MKAEMKPLIALMGTDDRKYRRWAQPSGNSAHLWPAGWERSAA